jgi:hypothetical protein
VAHKEGGRVRPPSKKQARIIPVLVKYTSGIGPKSSQLEIDRR